MFENDIEEAGAVLLIINGAGEERFGEALDGSEGRSEFVRDVGNKIAAHALEFSQLGYVVQHYDSSAGIPSANCGHGDRKIMLPQCAGDNFRLDAGLAVEHLAHRF